MSVIGSLLQIVVSFAKLYLILAFLLNFCSMKKPLKLSKLSVNESGDMVAGPYNPDRTLSFGDLIVRELELLNSKHKISPLIYNRAVDLGRKIERQLNHIYGGRPHGLEHAVHALLSLVRRSV